MIFTGYNFCQLAKSVSLLTEENFYRRLKFVTFKQNVLVATYIDKNPEN